jgi:hypothetical protein
MKSAKTFFLKFKQLLTILVLLSPLISFGQMSENNEKDTFFYFRAFDYYLNTKHCDTAKLSLNIDSKMSDIQKISQIPYSGKFEFAVFKIDHRNRSINVEFFNGEKVTLRTEVYYYNTAVKITTTKYFFSLTGETKTLKWKTIEPRNEKS